MLDGSDIVFIGEWKPLLLTDEGQNPSLLLEDIEYKAELSPS
jgi:hypothetical protein